MYNIARRLLFQLDAETTHHLVMTATELTMGWQPMRGIVRNHFRVDAAELAQDVFGIHFPNPVGLAAGFDKNAEHLNVLSAFGFGHIEIGTVTGEGQPGNERPRLFRLPADHGLLNRMGFNNHGSEVVARRLQSTPIEPILGVNIGKTKTVSLADAPADYEKSFRRLFAFARYFVVNVSSPNTPGLRELQEREPLTLLLRRLQTLNSTLADERNEAPRPILVKIAPDLSDAQLTDVVHVAHDCELAGIVATNTTIERDTLRTAGQDTLGSGGVSGRPVAQRRLEVVRLLRSQTDLPIIGVGGIFTASDALETLQAGANLVQVWTGFIYEGPSIVKRINEGLLAACRANGWQNISEARASS